VDWNPEEQIREQDIYIIGITMSDPMAGFYLKCADRGNEYV